MDFTGFFSDLHYSGLIVGLCTFLIIGLFHPLVIKGYYYFGLRCRIWFAAAGVVFALLSMVVPGFIAQVLCGVTAFSSFWSIKEVSEQRQRVFRGWFPAGPGHKSETEARQRT